MIELLRDRRGASAVTYVLILPLFILIVFGALQVWRIIAIKQSLHVGTYQTVRCLSMYDSRQTTRAGCETLLLATLANNGLIDDANAVRITYYDAERRVIPDPTLSAYVDECGEVFSMETELTLPGSIVIPYLPARDMTLHERKSSYIECPAGWSPITEGTPVTPLN
ncbi:MAG: TadE/TadG family type IV pilus assembly protein [Anaerolineae bacterium]|jgi:hypothetical protein